ncbi:MAG: ester cyclase [Chloroflexi bacterium]|nr:ester cyclase [Chloroflexota bacterium]
MTDGSNEALVRAFMDRAFNQGDLSAVDEFNTPDGIDHQEPPGTDLSTHLKQVVVSLRTAFPDLHFEIHDLLSAGDLVAFRSTMTGTHTGTLSLMPGKSLPATGRRVSVPHMHFVRIVGGKTTDLWHLWNMPMMMQQLGAAESAGRPDKAGH